MKYRIAVIDKDEIYLERFAQTFGEKYPDKLDVYLYTGLQAYNNREETAKLDLVLAESNTVALDELPTGVTTALLVEERDIEAVNGIRAICKYQKHETLIKQILEMCLEKESIQYTKKNVLGKVTKVMYVTSASGGNGVTTAAAAAAKVFAATGKKVLYISLEKNAATEIFFHSDAENNFTDVIYSLKSKKGNLISRIETIVQQDISGVYFFNACRSALDMNELTSEDVRTLLQDICSLGSFEYIVIDSTLEYNDNGFFLCDFADDIIVVTGAGEIRREKLSRLGLALRIWDQEKDSRFMSKVSLLYNHTNEEIEDAEMSNSFKVAGYIPEYTDVNENQIIQNIMEMPLFEKYV